MNLNKGNTQKIIAAFKGDDIRHLAYMLATTHKETGGLMLPVRERGGNAYFFKMYDPGSSMPDRAKLATKMGAQPGDGVMFYGRGYPQITWRANYAKFGKILGKDFTSSMAAADQVLEHENALQIMFIGMNKGLFTGKKLSDYIAGEKCDYFNARRIINGLDCAQEVADLAIQYYSALTCDALK